MKNKKEITKKDALYSNCSVKLRNKLELSFRRNEKIFDYPKILNISEIK